MDYLKITKQEAIKGIENNTIDYKNLTKELRDDRDIILEAVEKDGYALKYVSENFKDDKDFVLGAVKKMVKC